MIRFAHGEDITEMTTLLQQLFSIEEDFVFQFDLQKKGLQLLLESENSAVMVAEKKGAVIGMATAQLVISTAEGGLSMLVEDVIVDPAWQNRGIGSKLLTRLRDWGQERGAARMQLLADKTNSSALEFYNRRGWHTTRMICLKKYPGGKR